MDCTVCSEAGLRSTLSALVVEVSVATHGDLNRAGYVGTKDDSLAC